ncbi:DUF4942 domain-containing protein [Vibrio gangliei]|uniref:DUF4942 domain-containing protein n=1 Tax=Vibrio gangliei TaxID=2077090 RepID=UPI00130052E7|nr:DUF4942 domain-containing protein [Vibrio gangliei]
MTTALANIKFNIDLGNEQLNKTALAVNGGIIEHQFIMYKQRLEQIEWFYQNQSCFESVYKYISSQTYSFFANKIEVALEQLKVSSWKELLHTTGLYDVLPNQRKKEWENQEEWVDFNEENIKSTLFALLKEQGKFTAEKIDGCFKSLSKEHITNRPEGFYKRCIFALDRNNGGWHDYLSGMVDCIHDFRAVILLLTNRNTKLFTVYHTRQLLDTVPHDGQWYEMDGGTWKIRRYLKGTCHIEFHPEIAWQLNSILATIYGAAIPHKHRQPKKEKQSKVVILRDDYLTVEVLNALNEFTHKGYSACKRSNSGAYLLFIATHNKDKHLIKELERVLQLIGGVKARSIKAQTAFEFEYNPVDILNEIQRIGCIPDKLSHQFYPTNQVLAMEAVVLADIKDGDAVLEPSAGQGGIAKFLPANATLIEASKLHCAILRGMGFENVMEADFVTYAKNTSDYYDAIVMNPPFSEGRAELHLNLALSLLKAGGRLSAILPVSARNYKLPDGFDYEYSSDRNNQFDGTSVSVVILKATRQ